MDMLKKDYNLNNYRISRRIFLSLMGLSFAKYLSAKNDCLFTPSQPAGPFFKDKNLEYINDLTNNGKAHGNIITVSGRVLDKHCNPYSFSKITIWQANAFGKYNHKNDLSRNEYDINFNGYSRIITNKEGFYSFTTIIPGPYKISQNIIRPPHIHVHIDTENNKFLIVCLHRIEHKTIRTI